MKRIGVQRIAILWVQKPGFALFLHSENHFPDPSGPMFLYPTNAFRSFASGLEAHVGHRPVRGGEAIKTHRKVRDFQGNILIGFGCLKDYLQLCHCGNNYGDNKIA